MYVFGRSAPCERLAGTFWKAFFERIQSIGIFGFRQKSSYEHTLSQ